MKTLIDIKSLEEIDIRNAFVKYANAATAEKLIFNNGFLDVTHLVIYSSKSAIEIIAELRGISELECMENFYHPFVKEKEEYPIINDGPVLIHAESTQTFEVSPTECRQNYFIEKSKEEVPLEPELKESDSLFCDGW